MDDKDLAHQMAVALVLAGVALSRSGDSQRVIGGLVPELIDGFGAAKILEAAQRKDRDALLRALAFIGVHVGDGEMAVDAILRTHLEHARERAREQLKRLDAAWDAEEKRALERVKQTKETA